LHRKRKLWWIALGLTLTILSGCGGARASLGPDPAGADAGSASGGQRTIRIAHQYDAVTVIGQAKGWFEEEFGKDGTQVVYTRFIAGPPIMEAFSAGRQDIGYAGDMPPVAARASGVEVKVVGVSYRTRTGYTTVVRAESPIQSVQDLKSKTLAAQVGTAQYHYALRLLDQQGLTGQVRVVNIPLTELRPALESGSVDAIVANEQLAGTLEYEGVGRILPDSRGVKPGLGLVVARAGFVREHPDLVRRFLRVIRRVHEYIQAHSEEAAEIASREVGYPAPVYLHIFKDSDYDVRIRPDDIHQLELVRDFLFETKVIRDRFPITDLVDPRFAADVAG